MVSNKKKEEVIRLLKKRRRKALEIYSPYQAKQ